MATSNAPIIVLLDSCSYFRLGASFRPILLKLEGDPEYALKVLAELDREYRKSSRLKTKFWWAGQKEHADERAANCFTPSAKKANEVRIAFSYIDQYAVDNNISVSFIDKRVLSVGYACGGIVVTDDLAMQGIAKAFGIECFSTLALLKIMYVRGKAALSDIDRVIDYWEYERDLPTSFAAIKAWRQTLG
ncbi:MAG: hypothetical protein IKD42_03330 [Kiritimatiellae bacterium]|nr:hypothetical protein [Kiritimatiellia bacterium]